MGGLFATEAHNYVPDPEPRPPWTGPWAMITGGGHGEDKIDIWYAEGKRAGFIVDTLEDLHRTAFFFKIPLAESHGGPRVIPVDPPMPKEKTPCPIVAPPERWARLTYDKEPPYWRTYTIWLKDKRLATLYPGTGTQFHFHDKEAFETLGIPVIAKQD